MPENLLRLSYNKNNHHYLKDDLIEISIFFTKDVSEFNFLKFNIALIDINSEYDTILDNYITDLIYDELRSCYIIRLKGHNMQSGIFFLSGIELLKQDSVNATFPLKFEQYEDQNILQYYFKITDTVYNETIDDIINEVNRINSFRKKNFLKGIGTATSSFHSVYFFIKNIYLTKRFTYGQYEIIPFNKISSSNLYDFINDFISEEIVENIKLEYDLRKDIEYVNPTTVIFIPKIFSKNIDEAYSIGEKLVRDLMKTFSITRNTNGEIVSSIVIDPISKTLHYTKPESFIAKNILYGETFGENPFLNQEILKLIETDNVFSLCTSLYKDAINEIEIEIRYSKLWTILEVLSETQNYSGNRLKKTFLNGDQITKKNQKNNYTIKDKVRELIRDNLKQNDYLIGLLDPKSLKLDRLDDLITIWYRHRNCMVHSGGCQPNNPLVCVSKIDYELCKSKHIEILKTNNNRTLHNDTYLKLFELATRCILMNYFHKLTNSEHYNNLFFIQVSQIPEIKFEKIELRSLGKLGEIILDDSVD